MLNLTSSDLSHLLMSNTSSVLTGGAVSVSKDSFSNALSKNIVAMLVWLTLSVINGSMVHTFLRHRYTEKNAQKQNKKQFHSVQSSMFSVTQQLQQ